MPICMTFVTLNMAAQNSYTTEEKADSLKESIVSAAPKDIVPLRRMGFQTATFYAEDLQEDGIKGIKDISSLAPNLFIPDYGSRLTTPIYIRGIGSRTGSSPIGIYLNGIPVSDKSTFDFDLVDIERIDVMRGPQSTLYGKNSMGGLVRIFTKDPTVYEGTDLRIGAATYGEYNASVMHYHHPSQKLAFSGGFSYSHKDGFYRNEARDDEKVDKGDEFGVRFRAIVTPSSLTKYDFSVSYDYTDQGGYPYYYDGKIAYNRRSSYNRHLLNAGLNIEHHAGDIVVNSVTGFQYLKDRMDMDQDFTPMDIYSLLQKQKSRQLSEEITVKRDGKRWQWLTGAVISGQWLRTTAPVTFHKDGIDWLNGIISTQANSYLPSITSGAMTMDFAVEDKILDEDLAFNGKFKTPTMEAAIFHQSDFKDLFGVKGLKGSIGLRLDLQKMWIDYTSNYVFNHSYALNGNLTMPARSMTINMIPEQTFNNAHIYSGKLHSGNVELVPKFSLLYEWGKSNVYATVSRGYSTGGYNIQMFSEFLQTDMQNTIKSDIASATIPVVQNTPMIPSDTKETVLGILKGMENPASPDIESMIKYKPEHAWNYEIGTHLYMFKGRLTADLAAFLIDTKDLQLSKMADSGLGRVTVNSGSSRSKGFEASLNGQIAGGLSAHASYGYTHAKFKDERDSFVPFTPRNTVSAGALYSWFTRGWLDRVNLGADWHGQGKIYWTEDNSASQDFYGTLDARLTLFHKNSSLSFWAANITDKRAQAFFFESMGRSYFQKTRPFQAGIDLTLKF